MRVIRIPEDDEVPERVAREVFGGRSKTVLVITWSGGRWQRARRETANRISFKITDHERWKQPERAAFPLGLDAYLTKYGEPDLLVVHEDFVLLPVGFPGGHRTFQDERSAYCAVCKAWRSGEETC